MPRLTRLTPDTAVGASRDLLADLVSRHGRIGDMVSTMAHSPAVSHDQTRDTRRARARHGPVHPVQGRVKRRVQRSACLHRA